jgi:cytoskeleton protein RodZ
VSSTIVSAKEEENTGPRQEHGLGPLLRTERERRGLTYEDISERTRVRPQIIQAIEEEDWDRLPSPAFVRGFLRSYARVLSLDVETVLSSYGQKARVETDLLSVKGEPLRDRPRRSLFLIWMLAAVVALFVLWKMYGPQDSNLPARVESGRPAVEETAKDQAEVVRSPDAKPVAQEPAPTAAPEKPEAAPAETAKAERAVERAAVATNPEPMTGAHQLSAKINARTWAKIYVDDLDPREYMFQPGQQPKWSVTKGFYMIIGNAGGIELEWDGAPVSGLGQSGHVVRLRIPKDFRHRVEGN